MKQYRISNSEVILKTAMAASLLSGNEAVPIFSLNHNYQGDQEQANDISVTIRPKVLLIFSAPVAKTSPDGTSLTL